MKNIKKRLNVLEQKYPAKEPINDFFIDVFENLGYNMKERIKEKPLDYSSKELFEQSVMRLFTVDELNEILQNIGEIDYGE